MNLRKSIYLGLLALSCSMLLPPVAWSQCSVTTTMINNFPPVISVYKILNPPGTCMSVTNMNVNACFPLAVPNMTSFLVASANSTAISPTCSFVCDCGTQTGVSITIGPSDGLPVELMEFSVNE